MLDYNKDIAPMRQQYFPMLMGNKAFDRALYQKQAQLDPLQDRVQAQQENFLKTQEADLAFRRTQQAFEEERERMRSKKNFNDIFPDISSRVESLIEGNMPATQKQEEFLKLEAEYAGALSDNPHFRGYMGSQGNRIRNRLVEEQKNEALTRSGANSIANIYINSAAQEGFEFDPDLYKGVLEGSRDPGEMIDILSQVRNQRAQAKSAMEQQENLRGFRAKEADEALDLTTKVAPAVVDLASEEGGSINSANMAALAGKANEFALSDKDRKLFATAHLRLDGREPTSAEVADFLARYKDNDTALWLELRNKAAKIRSQAITGSMNVQMPAEDRAQAESIFAASGLAAPQ
jgi:hypothetical protein